MTTPSSDNPKLRRGSVSSASVPGTQPSPQRSRHVQSRLTIIPSPSPSNSNSVHQTRRSPRTSFSTSSFSQRRSTPSLQAYSHPLSPQEVYDLAVSSLQVPHPTGPSKDVIAPAGKSVTQAAPRSKFIPLTSDWHLPFVDRPSEVSSLLEHPVNASILTLVELLFTDKDQLSNFRRLVFETTREDTDDIEWISAIRTVLKPRSEILWSRLKTILGVPPDLDDDDYRRVIGNLSNFPTDITARLIFPNQSTTSTRRLPAPHRPSKDTRSSDTVHPIIEEVESTPNDDSATSEHEGRESKTDTIDAAAALCLQTTPLFVPGLHPPSKNGSGTKPSIDNSFHKQHRRKSSNVKHRERSPQELDISSLSSGSTGSSAPANRVSSLRRPSSQRRHVQSLHPGINKTSERAKSPLSGPPLIGTGLEKEREENPTKPEGEGHESDVSDGSGSSFGGEKGVGPSEDGDSHIMTGTGDIAEPRKPSLQPERKLDVPSRDIPAIGAQTADAAALQNGRIERKAVDRSGKPDEISTPGSSSSQSGLREFSGFRSPAVLPTALSSENIISNSIELLPESRGSPHFPASFSKSPKPRKPPRPISRQTVSQSVYESPTATNAREYGRTGHPRSHTLSSVSTRPQRTNTRSDPPPPPPTPATSRTSFSPAQSSPRGSSLQDGSPNLTKTGVRPRRAASMIQRHPYSPSEPSQETGKGTEDEETSKSCVEVEGLKDGVRGTANPLLQLEHQSSESGGS